MHRRTEIQGSWTSYDYQKAALNLLAEIALSCWRAEFKKQISEPQGRT